MPRSSRHASLLTPDVAIEEIRSIQERMDQDARRIYELSRSIYQFARRTPSGQLSSAYVLYANAWTRFAGMVDQGLKRTTTASRVITAALEQNAQEAVVEAKKPPIKSDRQIFRSPLPPNDDLVELFGEELINADE
jgi:hypothetical protein